VLSEEWLERRTNFTRSLAVMSMVGYILGLGDRHPSNLMLDQISGRVLHIDFGDCFEVAMHREKFPEKVPFRLTRYLNCVFFPVSLFVLLPYLTLFSLSFSFINLSISL
jgi:phosphatidylinositol kinase/protein kinase (PI-3  family)